MLKPLIAENLPVGVIKKETWRPPELISNFYRTPGGINFESNYSQLNASEVINSAIWVILTSTSPPHHLHMNPKERPFLDIKKVSKFLGISVSTINRLIKSIEFPNKKQLSPRRFTFMKIEIDEWINQKLKQ